MLKVRNSFSVVLPSIGARDVVWIGLFVLVDQLMTRNCKGWLWTLQRTGDPTKGLELVASWLKGPAVHFQVVVNILLQPQLTDLSLKSF